MEVFIYKALENHQIVGLLWADQNMRDFGDRHRLLKSSERQQLWDLLVTMEPSQFKNNIYFNELINPFSNLDNIQPL